MASRPMATATALCCNRMGMTSIKGSLNSSQHHHQVIRSRLRRLCFMNGVKKTRDPFRSSNMSVLIPSSFILFGPQLLYLWSLALQLPLSLNQSMYKMECPSSNNWPEMTDSLILGQSERVFCNETVQISQAAMSFVSSVCRISFFLVLCTNCTLEVWVDCKFVF